MLRKGLGFILLFTISCSCQQGGSRFGEIKPLSQLCVERLESNRFPLDVSDIKKDSGGVTLRYQFMSESCLCTSSPVLECGDNWTLTVNGKLAEHLGGSFSLGGLVHEGENVIELCGNGEIEPVSICGDFDVLPWDRGGWYLTSAKVLGLGSVAEQGLPFYAGELSYARQFEVPEKVGRRILRVTRWDGPVCEIWVNGDKAVSSTRKTIRKNIGPYLKPGPNDIEVRCRGLFEEYTIK
jgi:hypothetical protein